MKLFYFALAGFICLIWLGLFDQEPSGILSNQRTIPAETPFTVRTVGNTLTLESADPLTIAIDSTGYVAIWQMQNDEQVWLRHWQTWPHVRAQDNEIWVDWSDEAMTVRINQEVLWEDVRVRLACPCHVEQGEIFLP